MTLQSEAVDPMLPRKASKYIACKPYRKPTQVGGSSRPRRLRELWLRNSAKLPRNFGRRGATLGERIYFASFEWSQRNGGGDCLLKT